MDPVVLIGAAVGAAAVLAALDLLLRRPELGLAFLAVGEVMRGLVEGPPGVVVSGILITINDLLVVLLLVVVVARLLRGYTPPARVAMLYGAGLLLLASIARGVPESGLPAAVNEARESLYLFGAALYGATLSSSRHSRGWLGRIVVGCALVLAAIAIVRWGLSQVGLMGGWWYDPSQYAGLRVLRANEALIIAQGGLLALRRVLQEGTAARRAVTIGAVLGGCTLLLQHRSVWVVTTLGASWLVWQLRGRLDRRLVFGVIGGAAVAIALGVVLVDTSDLLEQASQADAAGTGTFNWRVDGWLVLLDSAGDDQIENAIIGAPYGQGWERTLSTGEHVNVAPHNNYLELLLRIGVLGLGLLLVPTVAAFRRLRRRPPTFIGEDLDDTVLTTLLLMMAAYALPYNLSPMQGLLLGWAVAVAFPGPGRPVPETTAPGGPEVRAPGALPPRTAG